MLISMSNPRARVIAREHNGADSISFDVDGLWVHFTSLDALNAFIADLEAEARDIGRELYGEHPTDEIERMNALYGLEL